MSYKFILYDMQFLAYLYLYLLVFSADRRKRAAYKEHEMNNKFTKNERLEIGRKIFEKELNREEAAVKYDINPYTARDYLRLYKATLSCQKRPERSRERQHDSWTQ